MKYINTVHFDHSQKTVNRAQIGILICNLGTPQAPTPSALRPYLKEFLSDPRIVELPRILWWCILNLIILTFRPAKAAKAYKKVWTDQGSPLATITEAQCAALKNSIRESYGDKVVVEWAMRYGQPSMENKIQSMLNNGVQKLFVLPMYPQYSATTTASTFDAVANHFKRLRWIPELRFSNGYHTDGNYIDALVSSIKEHWATHGKADKTIFSYHGIPRRYLHNGDPYHCYCHQTTRLVAEKLGMNSDEYLTCFQSRFGKEPWLQPYTDITLAQLAEQGTKSVAVVCPGFSADCLETIEEIDDENRHIFLEAGGETFHYIPALNARETHIAALTEICKTNIEDWLSNSDDKTSLGSEERYNNHSFNRI